MSEDFAEKTCLARMRLMPAGEQIPATSGMAVLTETVDPRLPPAAC